MKWKVLDSKQVFSTGFARIKLDVCELPDGRKMPHYYTLQMNDWINVVALTKEKKIILVRQYRHSVQDVMLEIPGGMIDSHKGELPEEAARRELQEETGYGKGELIFSNWHYPNPALQNNKMWTCVIKDCERIGDPSPDPYEDIRTFVWSRAEFESALDAGEIKHSIILASIFLARPYLNSIW